VSARLHEDIQPPQLLAERMTAPHRESVAVGKQALAVEDGEAVRGTGDYQSMYPFHARRRASGQRCENEYCFVIRLTGGRMRELIE
jgi:hypothetical protein